MATSISMIPSTQINHRSAPMQPPTIQESIKNLKEAKSMPEFKEIFRKIDLQDLFWNKTSGMNNQIPKYKVEYIEAVRKTKNLHQYVNMERLMTNMQYIDVVLSEKTFLKLVMQNIDAMKSLNMFDFKSVGQQSKKGQSISITFSTKKSPFIFYKFRWERNFLDFGRLCQNPANLNSSKM